MTAREECRHQRGDEPCIKLYAADMATVTQTYECVEWCPLLQKRTDETVAEPAQEAAE